MPDSESPSHNYHIVFSPKTTDKKKGGGGEESGYCSSSFLIPCYLSDSHVAALKEGVK